MSSQQACISLTLRGARPTAYCIRDARRPSEFRAARTLSDVARPSAFEANRFKIVGGCARRTTRTVPSTCAVHAHFTGLARLTGLARPFVQVPSCLTLRPIFTFNTISLKICRPCGATRTKSIAYDFKNLQINSKSVKECTDRRIFLC